MNRAIITRVINWRAIAVYFSVFLILLITAPRSASTVDIWGGFSVVSGMGRLNILGIIRWNLCVLPPVVVSILFMSSELGPLSTYTVMRATNMKTWYLVRLCAIMLANLVYITAIILLGVILGLNAKSDPSRLYRLMLVFPMHTILMSSISSMLLTIWKSPRATVFAYLIIDGSMVVWGSIFPDLSKYLLPFWGMVQSDALILQSKGGHLFITVGMTILLLVLLTVGSVKWLQSHSPAANPRNI